MNSELKDNLYGLSRPAYIHVVYPSLLYFIIQEDLQFPGTRCVHVHVFRKWPGAAFDAIIHVSIDADPTDANWCERIQLKWNEVQSTIQSVLRRAGADRVTVQPHFEGVTSIDKDGTLPKAKSAASWMSCVSTECDEKEKTCCKTLEDDDDQTSEQEEAIPGARGVAKDALNGVSAVSSV